MCDWPSVIVSICVPDALKTLSVVPPSRVTWSALSTWILSSMTKLFTVPKKSLFVASRQVERPQATSCDAVEGDRRVDRDGSDCTIEPQDGARHGSDIIRRDAVAVRRLGEIEHPSGRGDGAGAIEVGGGRGSCRHRAEAGELRGGVAERYATGIGERAAVQFDRAVGDVFGGNDRQVAGRTDFERLVRVADRDCTRSTSPCRRTSERTTPWSSRSSPRGRRRTSRSDPVCRLKR